MCERNHWPILDNRLDLFFIFLGYLIIKKNRYLLFKNYNRRKKIDFSFTETFIES